MGESEAKEELTKDKMKNQLIQEHGLTFIDSKPRINLPFIYDEEKLKKIGVDKLFINNLIDFLKKPTIIIPDFSEKKYKFIRSDIFEKYGKEYVRFFLENNKLSVNGWSGFQGLFLAIKHSIEYEKICYIGIPAEKKKIDDPFLLKIIEIISELPDATDYNKGAIKYYHYLSIGDKLDFVKRFEEVIIKFLNQIKKS